MMRQAGDSASRPLTRSSIKPRLLFPSEEQIHEQALAAATHSEVDEEAETDIEVTAPAPNSSTPHKRNPSHLASPPSSKRTKRTTDRTIALPRLEVVTEEEETIAASPTEQRPSKLRRKPSSPFDDWPRIKAGCSASTRKRGASTDDDRVESKRTRSGMVSSPA
jgi:hypothetical protein